MRKTFLFILVTLLYISCGGDDGGSGGTASGGSEYLNVSSIEIPGGNTTATLSIQASNNCEWVVSSSDSWIRSINPTKGRGSQNVTLTVTTNPSSSAERTAVINVRTTNGSISRNVTVTQSPSEETLQLSMETMTFANTAGNQDVTVTSNTHWTITGVANWLSLSKTEGDNNGSVSISATANTAKVEREAVLTFTAIGGTTKQLTVRQQADTSTDFRVSPSMLSADALATSVSFNIVGDAQWMIVSNSNWATPNITSGEGNATISVSLLDNTNETVREAAIIVSSSTKSETVTVRQSAATKPVLSDVLVADKDKTTATITFSFSSMFAVTEYGICYTTSGVPTINDSHKAESGSVVQGSASIQITGLTAGTTYNIRAYAKSAVGIEYSDDLSFTTNNSWPGMDDNIRPNV